MKDQSKIHRSSIHPFDKHRSRAGSKPGTMRGQALGEPRKAESKETDGQARAHGAPGSGGGGGAVEAAAGEAMGGWAGHGEGTSPLVWLFFCARRPPALPPGPATCTPRRLPGPAVPQGQMLCSPLSHGGLAPHDSFPGSPEERGFHGKAFYFKRQLRLITSLSCRPCPGSLRKRTSQPCKPADRSAIEPPSPGLLRGCSGGPCAAAGSWSEQSISMRPGKAAKGPAACVREEGRHAGRLGRRTGLALHLGESVSCRRPG